MPDNISGSWVSRTAERRLRLVPSNAPEGQPEGQPGQTKDEPKRPLAIEWFEDIQPCLDAADFVQGVH
jgi:hypothetical protein